MSKDQVLLTIVIVSWNVRDDLSECLRSIYASNFEYDLEVIVIDNASVDGSVSMIEEEYPEVRIVANCQNLGFPKANNQGLSVARGDFVLYLNPDTVVMPGTLSSCVTCAQDDPDIGLLGCKILYPDRSVQHECARNFPTLVTMFWESFYLHMVFPENRVFGKGLMVWWDREESRTIPCISGAFMLGRRRQLQRLGGMDEGLFMFCEDVDLCYRVWQAGMRVFYLADVYIIHKSGRSQAKYPRSLTYAKAEARCAFFRKHFGWKHALACRLLFLLRGVFRLTVSVFLLPIAALIPQVRPYLRKAWNPEVQWALLRWAVCRPAASK